MQAVDGRVGDKAKARTADNGRIEGSMKGTEGRLKDLEVHEGSKDESCTAAKGNAGSGEEMGILTLRYIILGEWPANTLFRTCSGTIEKHDCDLAAAPGRRLRQPFAELQWYLGAKRMRAMASMGGG